MKLKYINDNLEQWALTILYVMIFVTILSEVVQRFLLSYSTAYGEELARYCFVYLTWISTSLCVKERIHLKIDLITNIYSNRFKSVIWLICELVTLFIAIICIYLSMHPVILSFKYESITDGLGVTKGIFLFAVPFGFSILTIRVIQNIITDIKNIINNNPPYNSSGIFEGE